MLAAHHGQKRSRGLPLRSSVAMTLMPLSSTWSPSRGRSITSVAIASPPPVNGPTRRILLPATRLEILQFDAGWAARRASPRDRVRGGAIGELDCVRPAQPARQAGQVGADVNVSSAAGVGD